MGNATNGGLIVFAAGLHIGGFSCLGSFGRTLLFSPNIDEKGFCNAFDNFFVYLPE